MMKAAKLHEKVYQFQSRLNKHFGRIYILPTKFGLYFIGVIFILFLMSLSYGHSLAITGTFLFISIVGVSAHFTNFNLTGIKRSSDREELFLFRDDELSLSLVNEWRKPRVDVDIDITLKGSSAEEVTLVKRYSFEAKERKKIGFSGNLKRGIFEVSKIKVSSDFPFGLFRAWMYIEPLEQESKIYIYPRPLCPTSTYKDGLKTQHSSLQNLELLDEIDQMSSEIQSREPGTDQFYEHSPYREGDETKRIDWKIYSRTHELYQKHYYDTSPDGHIIDRRAFSSFPIEQQLSFLCFKVLEAAKHGYSYALVLNGEAPVWGQGKKFRKECLSRLSEFGG